MPGVPVRVDLSGAREFVLEVSDGGYGTEPFFSFIYDGRSSSQFLADWELERSSKDLDADRPKEATGGELMEKGLLITISDKPGASLITCKRAGK